MKILYTNGDSWTAGEELEKDPLCKAEIAKDPNIDLNELRSKYSYGGVMSKQLGYKHINGGVNGSSNHRIVRTTCEFIQSIPKEQHKDLLVVIGWTSAERHELFVRNKGNPMWCRVFLDQILRDDRILYEDQDILGNTPILKEYLRLQLISIYSRTALIDTYITQILLLSNLLQNLKIKHYFFDALSGIWDYDNNSLPKDLAERIENIKTKNMNRDISFSGFCTRKRVPFAGGLHCLTEGHVLWANDLIKRISNIYPEIYQ